MDTDPKILYTVLIQTNQAQFQREAITMEAYRLYYVSTAKPKPGKGGAAAKWWKGKGAPFFEKVPGVKSIRTYAT